MTLNKDKWEDIKEYLLTDRKHSDKESSILADKSRYTLLAAQFLTRDFNRTNFNKFIGELKAKGYSHSYINNFIKMGKIVDKYFEINQIQDYTYFPEVKALPRSILTPEEIEKLANVHIGYKQMNAYINQRQKTIIMLMGTTGCRVGEALGLKFEDLYMDPYCCIFRDTKTDQDRTVPISQSLHNALQALPKLGPYIFMSGRGQILEQQVITRDLKVRANAINLAKPIYSHLLRHSYITTMLENGVDISDVGVIVGHRDPKTIMRYKNSLIGHYVDIAHIHPLLKQEMSWEQQVDVVKRFSKQFVNINKVNANIIETPDSISLKLIKV